MAQLLHFICHIPECDKFVSFVCQCSNPCIHLCAEHVNVHRMTSGFHEPKPVSIAVIQDSFKSQCLNKINTTLLELKNLKNNKVENCKKIINGLESNLNSLIKSIKETKSIITRIKNLIITDQAVNSDLVSQITKIKIENKQFNLKKISNLISKYLESSISSEKEDEFVLFSKLNDQMLHMIDLNTMASSFFPIPQNYWYYGAACKISHNKYFISGGDYFGTISKVAVIINFEDLSYSFLASDSPKCLHSCIAKEDQVYSFGGRDIDFLDTAVKLDLMLNTWSVLPPLPVKNYTSSSLINNKILIIPQNHSFGYVFHENIYHKNLDLEVGLYCSCEKWFFSNTALYECLDLDRISWRKYTINKISDDWLSLNIAFKRNQYIYVIHDPNSTLWRIDTETKLVQKVIYA